MIPLRPFIPGLDENKLMFSRFVDDLLKYVTKVSSEERGVGIVENEPVNSAPWRVVPIRDRAGVYIGLPAFFEKEVLDGLLVRKQESRSSAEFSIVVIQP